MKDSLKRLLSAKGQRINSEQHYVFKNHLLFRGAVGASLSHETNNVFAIIGELNGLLEDLSISRKDSHGIDSTRLKSITERIAAQVERGKVYTKQLNGFSNSVQGSDQNLATVEVVNNVVNLCARFARLRKVRIENRDSKEPFVIKGELFDLQHILFRCIELALCASDKETTIDIQLTKKAEDIRFKITNKQPGNKSEDISSKIIALETITEHLGGKVYIDIGTANPTTIRLFLPYKLRNLTPP